MPNPSGIEMTRRSRFRRARTAPGAASATAARGRPWRQASRRVAVRVGVACGLAIVLAGCESFPWGDHDRFASLTRDDYRDAMAPKDVPDREPADADQGPPIPELTPLVDLPPPTTELERRLVSLSVNETVPLKDVLFELARKAEIDLALDPRIEGGIILTMRDRPLRDVIERIALLAGLRYSFEGATLRIELDEPYYVNYRVDYLNVTRQASSSVESSTQVNGSDSAEGNASRSSVSNESEINFWQELDASLRQILENSQPRQQMVIPAVAPIPAPPPAPPAPPAQTGGDAATDAPTPGPEGTAPAQPETTSALAQALTDLPLIGGDEPVEADDAEDDDQDASAEQPELFTINRQAGVVSVFASEQQHDLVAAYLEQLRRSISQQVLIEAKIFEVALSDQFQSGINWRAVINDLSIAAPLGTLVTPPPFDNALTATPDVVTIALDRGDLDVIANLIQDFGTVRTLSSPRLTVLQNQTAVLKVAENQVFFQLFFEREEQDDGDDVININSEIRTVPVGVVITVQPSINPDTEQVSLALRPTVTRVTGVVNDPAVAIASNNTVESQIPVIAIQEIDSVVTMQSGQVVIMGGLMRDIMTNEDSGLPVLSQLPAGLGYLFKATDDRGRQSELVIFLRATIVGRGDDTIDPIDADLYRTFGGDRRPFPMPAGTAP